MNPNIFSDLRKPGLVPGESLSLSTKINSVLEKYLSYIRNLLLVTLRMCQNVCICKDINDRAYALQVPSSHVLYSSGADIQFLMLAEYIARAK